MMKASMIAAIGIAAFGGAPAYADDVQSPFGAPAVAENQLATIAGQANIVEEIRATNTATVAHNNVSGNSVTGTISFDAGSFQNLNGLSVLSANTGNNVAINSSLNVNVGIHP